MNEKHKFARQILADRERLWNGSRAQRGSSRCSSALEGRASVGMLRAAAHAKGDDGNAWGDCVIAIDIDIRLRQLHALFGSKPQGMYQQEHLLLF